MASNGTVGAGRGAFLDLCTIRTEMALEPNPISDLVSFTGLTVPVVIHAVIRVNASMLMYTKQA